LQFLCGFGEDFAEMREAEFERGGEIRDELGSRNFGPGGPDGEDGGALRHLPPFPDNIVNVKFADGRKADGFSFAEPFAAGTGFGAWLCEGKTVGLPAVGELHIYDVVREWWQMTERAAVLAVWAARPEIATPELVADFSASLEFGLAHLGEICAEASKELQLPERE